MNLTPPRHFNRIIDVGEYYLKLSSNKDKILAEVEFYKSVPLTLKEYYPEVDHQLEYLEGRVGYRIKKIPVPDASYFYISDLAISYPYFERLFTKLSEYFDRCPSREASKEEADNFLNEEIIQKNHLRLQLIKELPESLRIEELLKKAGFNDFDSYLEKIHEGLLALHNKQPRHHLSFSHGDMCLSNLLLHGEKLFLIDPKGNTPEGHSWRSPYYDFAKLSQCFYGNYDSINLLKFEGRGKEANQVKLLFKDFCLQRNIDETYMKCMQSTFFFSMIPLHCENVLKMEAFLLSSIESWRTHLET